MVVELRVPEVLRANLVRLNMSQSDLARRALLSGSMVSDLVHGRRRFTARLAVMFGRIFDVPAETFYPCRCQEELAEARATETLVLRRAGPEETPR